MLHVYKLRSNGQHDGRFRIAGMTKVRQWAVLRGGHPYHDNAFEREAFERAVKTPPQIVLAYQDVYGERPPYLDHANPQG